MVPKCEECGKDMDKIIVDFEGDDIVLTAYECSDCQTIAELSKQSIVEIDKGRFPYLTLSERNHRNRRHIVNPIR